MPVGELTARDVWPWDATQDGIAAAVGIRRAHVAFELKRLEAKGLVEDLLAHVNGGKVRRKVYRAVRDARLAVHRGNGEPIPLTKGEVATIRVVTFRCPNCGRQARVALDE